MIEKRIVKIRGHEKVIKKEGKMKILELPIEIEVAKGSFLHIGAAPSPLSEKKGAVFKVDRIPVIPATSFKGALRHQLELLFIEKADYFATLFNLGDNKEVLKPCIPSSRPTKAEEELIKKGKYREKNCEIKVDNEKIKIEENGICPVCYFMGAAGLMGFLRISNFYSENEGKIINQTNIRIDRKTGTAAHGAKVEGEQVKSNTIFKGGIEIVVSEPILEIQGLEFGDARKVGEIVIDKWLENWNESDKTKRIKVLIEEILIPAIQNITVLGGQKSRGGGKVNVKMIL